MKTRSAYFLIIIVCSSILCFWRLGEHPLEEWDESRYGLNAYEMLQTRDFVNYYYEKQPDQWNAKPPLSIWLIALSYKIFGFNEFALRFPSALVGVLMFIVFFHLISYSYSLNFSLIVCLILMSTKAIIGSHVARTGDMDSLFVLFVLCSIYFFVRYVKEKKYFIYLVTLFLGLSFYVKGLTFLLLIPGLLTFLVLIKKLKWLFIQRKFWISGVIFLIICSSWYFVQKVYGNVYNSPQFIGKTSWDTMWKYDIVGRFLDHGFEENKVNKRFSFIITNLDVKFNLWNYLFYVSIILLIIMYKRKNLKIRENELLLLSLCIIVTVSVILTFSQNKRPWYIAPMMPFVAIVTTTGIRYIWKYNYVKYVVSGLLLFTLIRQFIFVDSVKKDRGYFVKQNRNLIENCHQFKIGQDLPQDLKLYSYWYNKNVIKIQDFNIERDNCYLLINKENYDIPGYNCFENYCLVLTDNK